jgi:hypothetical protein
MFSAIRFRQNIISALEGEAVHDDRIIDSSIMEKYGWTYNQLLETPFHVIVYLNFIETSRTDHKKIQDLKNGENQK